MGDGSRPESPICRGLPLLENLSPPSTPSLVGEAAMISEEHFLSRDPSSRVFPREPFLESSAVGILLEAPNSDGLRLVLRVCPAVEALNVLSECHLMVSPEDESVFLSDSEISPSQDCHEDSCCS